MSAIPPHHSLGCDSVLPVRRALLQAQLEGFAERVSDKHRWCHIGIGPETFGMPGLNGFSS